MTYDLLYLIYNKYNNMLFLNTYNVAKSRKKLKIKI